MTDRAVFWSFVPLAVLLILALGVANLWLGEINQDEGWYLYAARMVREGRLPYLDFAFTQGPLMPLVYAAAVPWVERWGLAGGRAFTLLLGLLAIALAGWAAAWACPRPYRAAALTIMLVGVNVYQSCFFTVVKTYALTAVLLSASMVALGAATRGASRWGPWVSGVLAGLAAGIRTSAAAVAGVVLAALLVAAWRRRPRWDAPPSEGWPSRSAWIGFSLGLGCAWGAIYGPFILADPGAVAFGLFRYHMGRQAGGLLEAAVYKVGFVSRMVQAYFVPIALVALLMIERRGTSRPSVSHRFRASFVEGVLWVATAAVTLVHGAAPFPYDDYQTVVFPLWGAALASALARRGEDQAGAVCVGGVLLLCALAAFSSPRLQEWVVVRRDRIWWPVRSQTSLGSLREAARTVRALAGPDGLLLTQDTYLAVEAGLRVPRCMELGPFCYFPDLSDEEAAVRQVLNRTRLARILDTTPARVAALSEWSFAIRSPAVGRVPEEETAEWWRRVLQRYERVAEVPDFGHAATRLRILRLNPMP